MSYDFLLTIAIIMLFTKVFGLTSERVHMPQVVGALIAGVLVALQQRAFAYRLGRRDRFSGKGR